MLNAEVNCLDISRDRDTLNSADTGLASTQYIIGHLTTPTETVTSVEDPSLAGRY